MKILTAIATDSQWFCNENFTTKKKKTESQGVGRNMVLVATMLPFDRGKVAVLLWFGAGFGVGYVSVLVCVLGVGEEWMLRFTSSLPYES